MLVSAESSVMSGLSTRLGWFVRRHFVRLVCNYVSTCEIFGYVGT